MNISNTLTEAGEVISNGLLIDMALKGLPSNFKPFTTECMCYSTDESSNMLQMKTTFKKINPKKKRGVSTHSRYDYKLTNYNYNN